MIAELSAGTQNTTHYHKTNEKNRCYTTVQLKKRDESEKKNIHIDIKINLYTKYIQ